MESASHGVPLSRLLELGADAVLAVRSGRSLTDVLARTAADARPGVQALAFLALRQLGAASQVRVAFAPKPPAPWIDALLCLALALLWPAERPLYAEYTVVDQAVRAARLRAGGAGGFVNAVLRRFLRERDAQVAAALCSPVAAYNHPQWWIDHLSRDWPGQWQAMLLAANQHPPMTLRVNRAVCSGADYVRRLHAAGLDALGLADSRPGESAYGDQAVMLAQPCAVSRLPGFAEGHVSVQDAAAQRAGPLLLAGGLRAGARVLDACAAPGGKTAQLLELAALDLLALDIDAARLDKVRDNLQRLHLQAEVRAGDALEPSGWWDGRPFEAVLLDAPCSASGIVRRHPDIRWLRRPDDIRALVALQARLLDALWPLLAPGGRLLYATCSLFKCEGQDQIDAFLQRQGAASAMLHPASPGHLLTVPDNPAAAGGDVPQDGFYYALIQKI